MESTTKETHQEQFCEGVKTMLHEQLTGHPPELQNKLDHLLQNQGKFFRPKLVYLVTKMVEGDLDQATRVATAGEMIHMASLVHDDVIDNASTRRGASTIHTHFGSKVAVLLGDYLFSKAFSILASYGKNETLGIFTRSIGQMCQGELIQLNNLYNMNMDKRTYDQIINYKTASLLQGCCEGSATLTHPNPSQIAALSQFGHHLGRAYQIIDDIMDYLSLTDASGSCDKPRGHDLQEGLITLPIILWLQHPAYPDAKDSIQKVWDQTEKETQLFTILDQLIESNAMGKAITAAKVEGKLAAACLAKFPESTEKKTLLTMVNKLFNRLPKQMNTAVPH